MYVHSSMQQCRVATIHLKTACIFIDLLHLDSPTDSCYNALWNIMDINKDQYVHTLCEASKRKVHKRATTADHLRPKYHDGQTDHRRNAHHSRAHFRAISRRPNH